MTEKATTLEPKASNPWERLEDFVREHIQQFIQALLEEEVTELLGRTKSARREAVDAAPGYRRGSLPDYWEQSLPCPGKPEEVKRHHAVSKLWG